MTLFLIWMLLFPAVTKGVDYIDRVYLGVSLSEQGYARRSMIQSAVYLATGLIFLVSAHV